MSEAIILLVIMLVLIAINIPVTYALGLSSLAFFVMEDINFMQFILISQGYFFDSCI